MALLEHVTESYKRYLEGCIRKEFGPSRHAATQIQLVLAQNPVHDKE
jgi:predicted GTPase